jgi:hypothetical protein
MPAVHYFQSVKPEEAAPTLRRQLLTVTKAHLTTSQPEEAVFPQQGPDLG